MMLSSNFSLKEMTQSQTALRLGLDNEPNEEQKEQNLNQQNYSIVKVRR